MKPHDTVRWRHILSLRSMILRIIGVICAAVAFRGFMIPNHFLDGGINGISILIYEIFHIPISIPLLLLNIPFLLIGYYKIGKTFAVSSLIAILMLSVLLFFIQVPVITQDKFLIAIFGGVFMGLAIGFVIRSAGVIDGLEVIAEYTTSKSVFSSGEIILSINTIIFLSAAYKFGIETAMYSIITFYTALKISQYVVDGFEELTEMTIVSAQHDRIKETIVKQFNKGISVYNGKRGFLPTNFDIQEDVDIIVTVLTRLEVFHLQNAILDIDPNAFIYIQSINEVSGGIVKKVSHH